MSQTSWERVKTIFHEVAAVPDAERAVLLDRACAGDDRLRAEVEALLASGSRLALRAFTLS